eukprot:5474967-Prymnesium_polylepis.1
MQELAAAASRRPPRDCRGGVGQACGRVAGSDRLAQRGARTSAATRTRRRRTPLAIRAPERRAACRCA